MGYKEPERGTHMSNSNKTKKEGANEYPLEIAASTFRNIECKCVACGANFIVHDLEHEGNIECARCGHKYVIHDNKLWTKASVNSHAKMQSKFSRKPNTDVVRSVFVILAWILLLGGLITGIVFLIRVLLGSVYDFVAHVLFITFVIVTLGACFTWSHNRK